MTTRTPTQRAKLSPKVIGGFIGSGVISLIAANFVPVFISGMTNDLGFTLGHAGLVATGLSLASVFSMWIANFFVATRSRAAIAASGIVLMVGGFGIAAALYTGASVAIGLIAAGLGCGVMGAASTAAISSTEDPDKSTTVVAIINRLAVSTLFLLAPIYFNDLRQVFLVLAGLGLFGTLLVRGLPNLPAGLLQRGNPVSGATPSRLRPLGIVLAIAFGAWSMTEDMVYSLTAAVFGVHSGLSLDASTSLLAYKVLGGLLGTILAPLALRTLGRARSIALIVLISTISKYLLITTTSPTVYTVALVLWGVVYLAVVVLVLGLAATMDITGRTGVFVSSFYIIGIALGPLVGGTLQPLMSFQAYALLDCLPALLFGCVITAVAHRQHRFTTQRIQTATA
ncbi:MFS transporter [Glutamicibacter endophyticus]